jgi:hypothetical protein
MCYYLWLKIYLSLDAIGGDGPQQKTYYEVLFRWHSAEGPVSLYKSDIACNDGV